MSLIKYEPINLLTRMQNEINHFFNPGDDMFPSLFDDSPGLFSRQWMPRVDIRENDTHYTVVVDVPGVDTKDIEVSMTNGLLSIKGERKSEKEEKKDNYRRRECVYGSFERSFMMPDNADGEHITAKGKDGVLNIQIAKKKTPKPKTIKIEAAK